MKNYTKYALGVCVATSGVCILVIGLNVYSNLQMHVQMLGVAMIVGGCVTLFVAARDEIRRLSLEVLESKDQ